jgi:hypothetical protein
MSAGAHREAPVWKLESRKACPVNPHTGLWVYVINTGPRRPLVIRHASEENLHYQQGLPIPSAMAPAMTPATAVAKAVVRVQHRPVRQAPSDSSFDPRHDTRASIGRTGHLRHSSSTRPRPLPERNRCLPHPHGPASRSLAPPTKRLRRPGASEQRVLRSFLCCTHLKSTCEIDTTYRPELRGFKRAARLRACIGFLVAAGCPTQLI